MSISRGLQENNENNIPAFCNSSVKCVKKYVANTDICCKTLAVPNVQIECLRNTILIDDVWCSQHGRYNKTEENLISSCMEYQCTNIYITMQADNNS